LNQFGPFAGLNPTIFPTAAAVYLGADTPGIGYTGFIGPPNFGSGSPAFGSGDGDKVGISADHGFLFLPVNYVSGSPLMDTSTWGPTTLSSLGVTPGTYVWRWGSGANADSFTLKAEAPAVPESATLGLMALGLLGAGLAGRKRRN